MTHRSSILQRGAFASVLSLAVSACMAQAQAQAYGPTPAAVWGYAQKSYQQGRWSSAYGLFAQLADMGHPDSARIALFMLRYGPRLYGTPWSASPTQIEVWTGAAARQLPPLSADAGD